MGKTYREHLATARKLLERVDPKEAAALVYAALAQSMEGFAGTVAKSYAPRGDRAMRFKGVFDPAQTYEAGSVVQRHSAAWVALVDATESPGASEQWRRIGGGR